MEKYGTAGQVTDENITRRMRIAFWVTKAKYTEYVKRTDFPRQQRQSERAPMSRLYAHYTCC